MFDLGSDYRLNQWRKDADDPADWYLTGDGTVPLASAVPSFLKPENMVCVTPDDYGYWEVQDRVAASRGGLHAIMPIWICCIEWSCATLQGVRILAETPGEARRLESRINSGARR